MLVADQGDAVLGVRMEPPSARTQSLSECRGPCCMPLLPCVPLLQAERFLGMSKPTLLQQTAAKLKPNARQSFEAAAAKAPSNGANMAPPAAAPPAAAPPAAAPPAEAPPAGAARVSRHCSVVLSGLSRLVPSQHTDISKHMYRQTVYASR
jgi:nucleoid-associated protein YgaU